MKPAVSYWRIDVERYQGQERYGLPVYSRCGYRHWSQEQNSGSEASTVLRMNFIFVCLSVGTLVVEVCSVVIVDIGRNNKKIVEGRTMV